MILHKLICKFLVVSVYISFVLSANLYTDRTQHCDKVTEFLHSIHVVSDTENKETGQLCASNCCSPATEDSLLERAAEDFKRQLGHNSAALQGLLDSTASTLREHVLIVIGQSENRTLALLDTVYRRPPRLGHPPVAALYNSIRKHVTSFIEESPSPTDLSTSSAPGRNQSALDRAVREFFERLFPLAYHHIAHSRLSDFTDDYKQCLMKAYDEVQPFGDSAESLAVSLRRSLQATRLLLRALAAGGEILRDADEQLSVEQDKECLKALARMTYCSKCKGLEGARPCAGYCLNVVRGCLAARVDGLDAPWNAYLEALRSLASAARAREPEELHMDRALGALDGKVSQAIMGAMEAGPELKTRVRKVCGHSALVREDSVSTQSTNSGDQIGSTSPSSVASGAHPVAHMAKQQPSSPAPPPPPDAQLLRSLAAAHESRAFYARLADTLCRDEAFAETREDGARECWNGQRLGEYTRVVANAGAATQRYNPEVAYRQGKEDPQIAKLSDRLRRVTSAALSGLREEGGDGSAVLAGNPGDLAMADMAPDGSGSGRGDWSDDEDWREGSGSGDGPDDDDTGNVKIDRVPPIENKNGERTSGSMFVKPTLCILLISWALSINTLFSR